MIDKQKYIPIIGLEVHVELKTKSKMFCGCDASYFGKEPNTHCCPVCLGLPGALPVPNKKAVEWCIMIGLALNCKIPEISKFDRKNYFYPDLPKGYQISQYDMPLCVNGLLIINDSPSRSCFAPPGRWPNGLLPGVGAKKIRIRRVHMEEDTGKLIHTSDAALIDFNRSGVPLVEIVTEPDFHSSEKVKIFCQKLQQIIRYLDVSDADMEKGSMRCEPNISVIDTSDGGSPELAEGHDSSEVDGIKLPSYKVEVKNINSFKFVEKAINFEIERQIEFLKRGETPKQETRGWSESKNCTLPQRGKEEAKDYRYFPEPDIPPMKLRYEDIKILREIIPELPDAKLARFMKDYGLGEYDAMQLTTSLSTADYFEECIEHIDTSEVAGRSASGSHDSSDGGRIKIVKTIANLIINKKYDINKTTPQELVKTTVQMGQRLQMDQRELEKIIKKILATNQKVVLDYKNGKEQALMFLIGLVMREVKGQANAEEIKKLLQVQIQLHL